MLPRHQFILWIAVSKRLATVDRLQKWGIQVPSACVLCDSGLEETADHDHLFVSCAYSKCLWTSLLMWLGEKRQLGTWNDEVDWMTKRTKNSKARDGILSFLFAASVYHIWQKRNARRFQSHKREIAHRIREIVLQLHIRGQQNHHWSKLLSGLNSFPVLM